MTPFTVTTAADMDRVYRLTYQCYLQQGYCSEDPSEKLIHFPKLEGIKETHVFGLQDAEGRLQATNSATVDGPRGLHTDESWPDETELQRLDCAVRHLRLGASWRICTSPENRNAMKAIFLIIDYTLRMAGPLMDVCLFTFHPTHARTYARLLGLQAITEAKPDETVRGSPSVLMRGEVKTMQRVWYAGMGGRAL